MSAADSAGSDGAAPAIATREQVLERIRVDSRFVLASHEGPDGDALGSLVGMHGLLTGLGKDTVVFIAPGPGPVEIPASARWVADEWGVRILARRLVMRQLIALAFATLLCAGCASVRSKLPSADFELEDSAKFFAPPAAAADGKAPSNPPR